MLKIRIRKKKMLEWQKPSTKFWLRGAALLTAFIFTVTNTSWAGNNAGPASPAASIPSTPGLNELKSTSFFDSIRVPESMGEIKKSFQGSRDRIVVHIQDAHVNEDAQKNIAQILDFFSKQYGMKLVNLEGAEGRLYPEVFSFFPDKSARQDVAEYFLKQGRLSGPLYWAVVERPEAELFGIEDNALYEENRKAYLSATGNKERDEEILEKLGKILSEISRYVFSEDLQKLVKQRGSFQEGGHERARRAGVA